MVTQLASGVFKYSGQLKKQKDSPGTRAQPLLYLWIMMYVATYNRICHLPDIRYDVTSRATTVGNVLPAVAFPSRDQHTVVFTGLYPGLWRALTTGTPVFPVQKGHGFPITVTHTCSNLRLGNFNPKECCSAAVSPKIRVQTYDLAIFTQKTT